MMEKLFINGKNAYKEWGVFLEDGSRNKLILGIPLKEFVQNKSRLQHGKQVLYNNPVLDERDIELVFCFVQPGNFVDNYNSFMSELYKGEVKLRYVSADMDSTFRLTYLSCHTLNTVQYVGKIAVRFNEPNPNNRSND